jgi:hypothetical protein
MEMMTLIHQLIHKYSLPNYITSIAVSSGGSSYGTEPPGINICWW